MLFLLSLIELAVNIYIFIIVIQVALTWLIAFDIVNAQNPSAIRLMDALRKATDPVYKKIRKYVPPIGGLDLTPLIVIIGLQIGMSLLYGLFI
ncbi:MAG: YggT family protein [Alphaproteobacteria bacterium]|nr:YggT family protein [Alphaproteobacteria bacterium]